jgi:hypothetical protein
MIHANNLRKSFRDVPFLVNDCEDHDPFLFIRMTNRKAVTQKTIGCNKEKRELKKINYSMRLFCCNY